MAHILCCPMWRHASVRGDDEGRRRRGGKCRQGKDRLSPVVVVVVVVDITFDSNGSASRSVADLFGLFYLENVAKLNEEQGVSAVAHPDCRENFPSPT